MNKKHQCYGTIMTAGWRCKICGKWYDNFRVVEPYELTNTLIINEDEATKTNIL